jgi:hypothetical protein
MPVPESVPTNLNLLTLVIDSRTGSAVMRADSGEQWVGSLSLSPADRTAISSPELTVKLTFDNSQPA